MDVAKNYGGYDVEVPEDDDFDLEYINLNEEKILKNEVERQERELGLTLNLMYKQNLLRIVKIVDRGRVTKAKIDNIFEGIKEQARIYEKDYIAEKVAIDDYEREIRNLESKYRKGLKLIHADKGKFEEEEYEAMDKKSNAKNRMETMKTTEEYKKYVQDINRVMEEFIQAAYDEDLETEEIKRGQLKELKKRNPEIPYRKEMEEADALIAKARERIAECEEKLIVLDQLKNDALDEIEDDKNKAFSGLEKQNFWRRILGSLVNKFTKANKIKNNVFGKIKELTAKMKEKREIMIEEYESWQEERAQAKAGRQKERAQAKAGRQEEKRKHKEDIINDKKRRLEELEKQLEAARTRSGKNMTPALAGDNIVPFEGRD